MGWCAPPSRRSTPLGSPVSKAPLCPLLGRPAPFPTGALGLLTAPPLPPEGTGHVAKSHCLCRVGVSQARSADTLVWDFGAYLLRSHCAQSG